eukprot:TRINITY_DN19280_c0_g1_i1.p2 TRINITY_DN19280_c0_g1~~TRINITY_DN19280_c0_g1_i1.p2  ORF type:complete len:137 (+),score=47.48 TRINITY_DN19280_c0_g1_i1:352-762(+)
MQKAMRCDEIAGELEAVQRLYDEWERNPVAAARTSARMDTAGSCAHARPLVAAPRYEPYEAAEEPAAAVPKAPSGEPLEHVTGLPQGYADQVHCDECRAADLQQRSDGFGHAPAAEYDVCNDCVRLLFPAAVWPPE